MLLSLIIINLKPKSLKAFYKINLLIIVLLSSLSTYAQHQSIMTVEVNTEKNLLNIQQELIYYNESNDTLSYIVLNDWNNAYSSKNTVLAKRFSDEFIRSFHLASDEERGSTNGITIIDENKFFLDWYRTDEQPDLIKVDLHTKLPPHQKIKLNLTYKTKIPSDKFTRYGYNQQGEMNLKNWFLSPARYENHDFIRYSNANTDDIENGVSDYNITIKIPVGNNLFTDLNATKPVTTNGLNTYVLSGKNRNDFSMQLTKKNDFQIYRNDAGEVVTDLRDADLNEIQKALLIDKIINFTKDNLGVYPNEKILVSQTDYDRNPFYGLNQLPSFMSPFSNDFLFEIKFLKTYLNAFLKNSLKLDSRKDNWIYDGIQVYIMMKYIDENYPGIKMMGKVSKMRLLKSYNLTQLDFNEQYSYFYMLMARKNLDQPVDTPKDELIKFNEQIAGKYRAGLSFRYLSDYIGQQPMNSSIMEFYKSNLNNRQTNRDMFESVIKSHTEKNIDWFFNTIIDSRKIVDYKFTAVSKTKDSVTFTVRNKTQTVVPIPVYGVNGKQIVFKQWLENIKTDSTFTLPRKDANKIVLNYQNEVPEYNLRNNWKSLKSFRINNRPIKFVLMKDLEDPYYNQILYVPTVTYNLYDGLSPGFRFHNKTILDKPFIFDINPIYSPNTQSLIGNFSLAVNQNNREKDVYNIRYQLSGSYFHYAPDAAYTKINPGIYFRIREDDFRNNHKQLISVRNVIVNQQTYALSTAEELKDIHNYSVFNAKYSNTYTEAVKSLNFTSDIQFSKSFGKTSVEFEYRKLFDDNRQINIRMFAGAFLYNNTNSDYFNFGLDRPTDYLFDSNYYGRSEKTGLFSQQLIIADGGFKSKLDTTFSNQWMATTNVSFNIWNWVEVYGDLGLVKNKYTNPEFVYDNGIRLNLVTDYFELYFPVYSNNGWEVAQPNYNEKIRFIVTLDPKVLFNLFTRKWL